MTSRDDEEDGHAKMYTPCHMSIGNYADSG